MNAAPKFAITPSQQQLDQLDRTLEFTPATISVQPQSLSSDQVAQFNSQGFLKGIRIFDAAEIAGHRKYFDALLQQVIDAGGDSYSISTAHMTYGRVWDLLSHERIAHCVADLLGPNVIGWGSHYFCKMPRDGKSVSWHQDASYWPLSHAKTVTVWLAIDDADRENACMQFIAGSHTLGHLTYRMTEDADHSVLNQVVDNVEQFGQCVDVELQAGEMSIHADLLLHGSEGNQSDRRRCGLTLRYCAADVRAGLDWNQKGVVVAGSDPDGHWGNPPRPDDR
jgi:chlorinating enzyme